MNRDEFYAWLIENFALDGTAQRLIDNILFYVESRFEDVNDQHIALTDLLVGIGLDVEEIEQVRF